MRNYLIIVEGAHDIAIIQKLLKLNGVTETIGHEKDLPEVWKHTIPVRFPFSADRLDRITPIPSFVKNSEISVAIKNANSDKEIVNVLQQTLHFMEVRELDQLSAVMLVCDADKKNAVDKQRELFDSMKSNEGISFDEASVELDIKIKKVPLHIFIFPDNCNEGNLENLLLQTAEVAYPELLNLASDYVEKASDFRASLKKEQNAKKAKVGCISNAMKPGKANQVSICDDDWVTVKTLSECAMLRSFDDALKAMIFNE